MLLEIPKNCAYALLSSRKRLSKQSAYLENSLKSFSKPPYRIRGTLMRTLPKMITLSKKLKKTAEEKKTGGNPNIEPSNGKRASIRDYLLAKEVPEMEANLPCTCKVTFSDPNQLHVFDLVINPDEGYWQGGKFHFCVFVTEEYNMVPPKVRCKTKLWHPNINEDGEICLSLLRQNSIDGLGWAPTRRLKDVVWGINSLFTDLLNFDDPLNIEAADHYLKDKEAFKNKVRDYVQRYAKR